MPNVFLDFKPDPEPDDSHLFWQALDYLSSYTDISIEKAGEQWYVGISEVMVDVTGSTLEDAVIHMADHLRQLAKEKGE